jgi:hypothetical protein
MPGLACVMCHTRDVASVRLNHRDPYFFPLFFPLFGVWFFGSLKIRDTWSTLSDRSSNSPKSHVSADSGIDYGVQRAIDVTRFAVLDFHRALNGTHQQLDGVDSACEFATLRADRTGATSCNCNIFRNEDQSRMGVTDNISIGGRIPNSRPSRSHFA